QPASISVTGHEELALGFRGSGRTRQKGWSREPSKWARPSDLLEIRIWLSLPRGKTSPPAAMSAMKPPSKFG
ncbi:MAG: hypothetical protein VYE53_10655, partial [Planctomycetota bacterium]|nr:hypothetical protein [Planctomycetota bacterium]